MKDIDFTGDLSIVEILAKLIDYVSFYIKKRKFIVLTSGVGGGFIYLTDAISLLWLARLIKAGYAIKDKILIFPDYGDAVDMPITYRMALDKRQFSHMGISDEMNGGIISTLFNIGEIQSNLDIVNKVISDVKSGRLIVLKNNSRLSTYMCFNEDENYLDGVFFNRPINW